MHLPSANKAPPLPGGCACFGWCLVRAISDCAPQVRVPKHASGPLSCMLFALARVIAVLLRQVGYPEPCHVIPSRSCRKRC
ncbi:hypothetical protein JL2886_03912 [Phaeobacter gallaeciensis]|uniref:Uncharacterized protein n=1 Tax=Phaeobacter gallaeciensis TaxID=60890 RepID=A0A1B0ZXH4_9RHOB|nr:hypothetical protein JL2886_03912 [Phaeobacter gallaeciensis]